MDLEEFRASYINEDINAEALTTSRYEVEVFIDSAADILKNDYSLITDMLHCYYEFTKGNRAFKSMHIDAAYLDLPTNTLNLLLADYNQDDIKSITNEFLSNKSQLLINYFENCLKHYFVNAEQSDPAVQLARDICSNVSYIYKLHLFIVSTNRLSKAVKKLELPDYNYSGHTFKIDLDVLDIEGIYRSKLVSFQKDDVIINCSDFGILGIPCIKAEIETDQYQSYLAIVPGPFLADIYKKHNASLLEANVRSFLKFNGGVNKGIRATILNEKSRFFTYNNGISTMAKEISTAIDPEKGLIITSFTDLQIINGGQTTATLASTTIKNNADLSGVFVQMKLTVLNDEDPELVRNIARYANSQNKVKTADLNSSHPFYVTIEEYSRKVYTPKASGALIQQLWFFERARGQYEQAMMQMTKKQRDDYKLIRPKSKKFTLTDLAKYANAADMLPHYVSWGGEINAAQFHNNMLKQWSKDSAVFNELYFKELIGEKIMFSYIENIISAQAWYQEHRAYRPQLVAYTFSKLVYMANEIKKKINFRQIWDAQEVSGIFETDVAQIAKLVFDCINDPLRSTANIETYCKKEECWTVIKRIPYSVSDDLLEVLIDPSEHNVETDIAKKDKKFEDGLTNEIALFQKGTDFWHSMIERGTAQDVLNAGDTQAIKNIINYCDGTYMQLSKTQLKEANRVIKKLKENGIE